jgi:hypothetical protein
VSVARISTIEQNPGAVGLKQLMQLMHSLGARLTIEARTTDGHARNPSILLQRGGSVMTPLHDLMSA